MTARRFKTWFAFPFFLLSLGVACVRCSSNNDDNDGGTCAALPELSASDLACETDQDCTVAWTGNVCSCGCFCPGAPANSAAQAREQAVLQSLPRTSSCTTPSCECPAVILSRCVAHQCTACSNPAFGALPGNPPSCAEDAGVSD